MPGTNPASATMEATRWELFNAVAALTDDRAAAAQGIHRQLVEALTHDEYAIALQSRLSKLEGDAIRLLTPQTPKLKPTPGIEVVETASSQGLAADEASTLLAELGEKVEGDASLKLDLSWKLYRKKGGK